MTKPPTMTKLESHATLATRCAAFLVGAMMALPPLSASSAADQAVLYDDDGVLATVHGECDATPYVLVTLDKRHDAVSLAAHAKFADMLAPVLDRVFMDAAAWSDGPGGAACGNAVPAETLTVVGLVNALPVYAVAAGRSGNWRPGSVPADARAVSALAAALPPAEADACATFEETIVPRVAKLKTKIYTTRAAHTTGQWNDIQGLTALVPLHEHLMALTGEWGFDWDCAAIAELIKLTVVADLERAVLLGNAEREITKRVAEAETAEERAALMRTLYRSPDYPPIADFSELTTLVDGKATLRYGGYRLPVVARIEAIFAK